MFENKLKSPRNEYPWAAKGNIEDDLQNHQGTNILGRRKKVKNNQKAHQETHIPRQEVEEATEDQQQKLILINLTNI